MLCGRSGRNPDEFALHSLRIDRFAMKLKITINHGMSDPATIYWPATSSRIVYSRVPPVCQHRPVLYPRGIATHAINQNQGLPIKVLPLNKPRISEPTRLILTTPDYSRQVRLCLVALHMLVCLFFFFFLSGEKNANLQFS